MGLFTKKVVCEACGMKFGSADEMKAHGAKAHAKAPAPTAGVHKCDCGASFANVADLKAHAKAFHSK